MKQLLCLLVMALAVSMVSAAPKNSPRPVSELPYWPTPKNWYGRPGWEERGPEFRRWLAPSVRVTRNGGGGSGTICYYDSSENWAYVVSCGHLFARGYKSRADYEKRPDKRKVEVFYHNEVKLDKPAAYEAEVLCHVFDGVYDVSLMRFHPDWKDPWVCGIAPKDYKLEVDREYHSCGCDGLSEVAHYLVTYLRESSHEDISEIHTSNKNGPRGGRSGGGVFTDDHQLVFICSRGDNSKAYWTSLLQIHTFLTKEGFQAVLDGRSLANRIPIVDRNGAQGKYPADYIPTPGQ